jgi:hypothetical protein
VANRCPQNPSGRAASIQLQTKEGDGDGDERIELIEYDDGGNNGLDDEKNADGATSKLLAEKRLLK